MKAALFVVILALIAACAALAWRAREDNQRIERLERALVHLHGG